MLEGNVYKHIIKNSSWAYFYGELICHNDQNPDFIILDTNHKFESLINIEENHILGQSIVNIFNASNSEGFEWVDFLENIKVRSLGNVVEIYIETLNKWFNVHGYHHKDNYFIIQLIELDKKIYKEHTLMKGLIDNLPFSAWVKDKLGRYIIINKCYEKESGFSYDQIIGKNDNEIFSKDLAQEFRNQDYEAMEAKNKLFVFEEYFNGECHLLHKIAIEDKENILGIVGFSLNTNEEKKAKGEVEQKNKFLKSLIDSIPDFIFYKDLQGYYLGLNESLATQYFGKLESELIGKNYKELKGHNKENESFIKQDEEIIAEKDIRVYEESLLLVDGDIKEYETIKSPFYDENNNIMGVLGISRDITHRNIAEKSLKESEEKFRQLAENIENMFLIYEEGKVTYVSPGYEKIFGRSCKDLYKNLRNMFNYICPEDQDIVKDIEFTENVDVAFRIIRGDGATRWVWLKGFPLRDDLGNVVRALFIAQDITAIKEAEKELERLRTEFFANLSHEFRTPLNLIFSSLQMVEFKLKQSITADELGLGKYTNIIRQNSFRLLRLVNNLIDSTKIDAGYVEYNPENSDIISYVKGIAHSVSTFAKEKHMDIIFNSQLQEKVIAFDLDKMERIILNLISNAIKFNKPNGKIEIQLCLKNGFVEIHVKDNGIGIPVDKLSYIFERFKQVNNRLTKVSEGSGIGLALVKSLLEMHKGTIEVISALGEGTEFIVKLPDAIIDKSSEISATKNQVLINSRVERIQIEFSDIYGLSI